MISRELLRQVRRIEIMTTRLVNEVMGGEYHSVFKGRGMEFDEVREYQPGDDVRLIDWNVTARTGSAHVKRFVEERELTVMLAVDASRSNAFGSGEKLRNEAAAEICALLALSALKNHDRVGLMIFTDTVEKFIAPKKGRQHGLRLIRDLLSFQPAGRGTDLPAALEYLNRMLKRKAVVFLVSDFICDGIEMPLRIVNRRHDLIAIPLSDPRETALPPVGLVEFEDAESGETALVDTSSEAFQSAFGARARLEEETLVRLFRRNRIDAAPVTLGRDYVEPMVELFRRRASRY